MAFCPKCGAANDGPGGFCRACGNALSGVGTVAGVAPSPIPPAPMPPAPKKKMNTGLKVVLILLLVFVGLPVLATIILTIYYSDSVNTKKAATDPCEENSAEYLYGLQYGKKVSSSYWKPKVTPMGLISVHSVTLLTHGSFLQSNGQPYKVPRVYYQYEVESSNTAGVPIRKHWNIVMEPDSKNAMNDPCAIVMVVEAQ